VSVAEAAQTTAKAPRSTSSGFVLQRKCACGGSAGFAGECSDCRTNRLLGKPLQTKLRVNEPGDEYEQEADRVAEQVMRMPDVPADREAPPSPTTPLVQRKVSVSSGGTGTAPPIVHEVLSSPGQPLDTATRAFFEPRFGHDFSHIRIHSDAKGAESARSVNAQAYTVGNHIVAGPGRFASGTRSGHNLLAHELTHVVQQQLGEAAKLQREPISSGVEEVRPFELHILAPEEPYRFMRIGNVRLIVRKSWLLGLGFVPQDTVLSGDIIDELLTGFQNPGQDIRLYRPLGEQAEEFPIYEGTQTAEPQGGTTGESPLTLVSLEMEAKKQDWEDAANSLELSGLSYSQNGTGLVEQRPVRGSIKVFTDSLVPGKDSEIRVQGRPWNAD
jgi:Domain of unknown function (DUF4157)